MKYARKLNLVETFYTKLKIFENENNNNNSIMTYPYEIYCKDIEYIKFIRKNIYNYDLGIQICDESIKKFSVFNDANDKDFISYVINNFKGHKAYFNYKKGNIIDAHKLFMEASIYNNKQFTDYHLYYDWAEMCEEIAFLIKNEENATEWFENTIHNYLTTIIYKLDKAKYIIPRMIIFIKEFEGESLKDKFNEKIIQIPSWVWIFWLSVLFDNFNYYQDNENKNDFYFIILKKVALEYKQIFYYPYTINEEKVMYNNHYNNIREKYKEFQKIIFAENKYNHYMDKIKIMIDELTKKEKNNLENSLNSILNSCENVSFRKEISEIKNYLNTIISILNNFPDLAHVKNNFEELMKKSEITREAFRDCIINNKYYNHNLIVTKNKFNEISKLCEDSIHNIDFTGIELPGYFSNKIEEPTEENILYISKFESEYSQKFNCDARSKVLIKCSNDKLLNFILINQNANENFDMKIYLMQILFNFIFAKNNQTYKRKILFITPIKYHINSNIKIVEEDIDIKYNMDEIYEYCLQKRGYSPKIANQIFEDEATKGKINTDSAYYNSNNNEKIFYKMCEIIPQDSLKNYIHKFILTTEDIFIFRKQFTISYAINNLFSYIISDNILLKNISFEKETGFCIFNTDMSSFKNNQYNEIIEQKKGTPLRLTKNISFFLSITSIYGIMPEIFYLSCQSLLNKSNDVKNILKICLNDNNIYTNNIKAQNYINKFKYVINLLDDKNYFTNDNLQKSKVNLINKENYDNNEYHQNNKETFDKVNHTKKIIYELIENSMNNDNLKKKTIDYEAWF
jgi:hypothetical protein